MSIVAPQNKKTSRKITAAAAVPAAVSARIEAARYWDRDFHTLIQQIRRSADSRGRAQAVYHAMTRALPHSHYAQWPEAAVGAVVEWIEQHYPSVKKTPKTYAAPADVPDQPLLDLYRSRLSQRPYCYTSVSETGLLIRTVARALEHSHVQHNQPLMVSWLVFDYDRDDVEQRLPDPKIPRPNLVVMNPENGRCHLYYALRTPVYTHANARQTPIRYAAAVEGALRRLWGADEGYTGLISKNPLHPLWATTVTREELWELSELAEFLTLPARLPRRATRVGLGRNVALFDSLRVWAYAAVEGYRGGSRDVWGRAVQAQAEALNENGLLLPELSAVARSVAKWVWSNYKGKLPDAEFSQIQSARGQRGGRPRTTTAKGKPWEKEGISRATWYRRNKDK